MGYMTPYQPYPSYPTSYGAWNNPGSLTITHGNTSLTTEGNAGTIFSVGVAVGLGLAIAIFANR